MGNNQGTLAKKIDNIVIKLYPLSLVHYVVGLIQT